MAVITVTVGGVGSRAITHPHVTIVGETKTRVVLPLAAKTTHDGLAMKFASADRQGDYPLSSKIGNPTHQQTLEIGLMGRGGDGRLDRNASIEPILQQLRGFARTGERIQFLNLGKSSGGWWEITSLGFGGDEQRQHGTNDITATVVHLTIQKASNQAGNVGPLTGGAVSVDPKARTVAVHPAEPLVAAAFRATGDGRNWVTIADANGVTAPYALPAGTILRVPRAS